MYLFKKQYVNTVNKFIEVECPNPGQNLRCVWGCDRVCVCVHVGGGKGQDGDGGVTPLPFSERVKI